jgi:hypothetical protein
MKDSGIAANSVSFPAEPFNGEGKEIQNVTICGDYLDPLPSIG